MAEEAVQVFIVDDEPEVTASLAWLLKSVSIPTRTFNSPSAFLAEVRTAEGPICAVLDLRMPEMSGLELQQQLLAEKLEMPLIFLSAHGDVPAAVNAMQMGAVDFLQKPFNPQDFLNGVNRIVRQARERHGARQKARALHAHLEKLSGREIEILDALIGGQTSKEIARRFAISPRTVDVHRANIVRKMGVASSTELLRLVDRLGYKGGG
jgi:two-component system response regulator FixJ